jgi:hypothetical protein
MILRDGSLWGNSVTFKAQKDKRFGSNIQKGILAQFELVVL